MTTAEPQITLITQITQMVSVVTAQSGLLHSLERNQDYCAGVEKMAGRVGVRQRNKFRTPTAAF